MIVALAYSSGEQDRVAKLLSYILSLNQYNTHTLILGVEKRVTRRFFAECLPFFGEVIEFDFVDQAEHAPESKNLAFQQSALYIQATFPNEKRFLYLESDAVPLSTTWLDDIEGEAAATKKPFVGPLVAAVPTHRIPQHMGAVAVYPVDMIGFGAGDAMIAAEQPWPAAIAGVASRTMEVSRLIADDWEGKGIPEGCALYHPDREGKILESLWKGREVAQPTAAEAPGGLPGPAEASSVINLSSEGRAGSNPAPSIPFAFDLGKTHAEPWEDRLQSEETIKFLAKELKKYCTKPAYIAYVRAVLKKARVTGIVPRKYKRAEGRNIKLDGVDNTTRRLLNRNVLRGDEKIPGRKRKEGDSDFSENPVK